MFGDILGALSGGANQNALGNAANAFNQQANQYNPWIDRGNQAGDQLMSQYGQLTQNPNALQNQISQGFYQSPYQSNLINQTTQQMNMNSANSGMLQSPAAQKALNDQISAMTGQFMNDYTNRGMQTYGMGLQGLQGTQGLGFQGLQGQSDLRSQGIGAQLKADQSAGAAGGNMLGMLGGLGMAYATGGLSGLAPMAMGAMSGGGGFSGAGSLMPNTGGWTGGYSNPFTSSYGI